MTLTTFTHLLNNIDTYFTLLLSHLANLW